LIRIGGIRGRHALKVLKEQGTWDWEQKPLLDEYVFSLMDAEGMRLEGKSAPWDRAVKRAMALADQLVLTPRARKAYGLYDVEDEEESKDPFDALDELAPRRAQAA
jgi:NAD(P)H-hydrate repair Nnr-like enzyme with NAD(P)H-hydrate dehydratase domain